MPDALLAALAGLGTGMSLIVAIGAQNAFVLRQGIRREHVAAVVAICAVSDAVLIAVGISGVGSVIGRWPSVVTVTSWVGGAFLVGHGLLAARRALRPAAPCGPPRSPRTAPPAAHCGPRSSPAWP